MASSNTDDLRLTRLFKFFNDVLFDRRSLSSSKDCKLFIEAVCAQADNAACSHKLLSSPKGLAAIQTCVRSDTSPSFINEHAVLLLKYLQEPSLKGIESGTALARILLSMVDPPFFWDSYAKAFRSHMLNPSAFRSFAWLLLQLVFLPGETSAPYQILAKSSEILELILKSSDGEARILGQKIKHSLSLEFQDLHIDANVKPGGRHDNDHEDHRRISIMPTADELLSKENPFLRTADFIDDPKLASSLRAIHIDNHFRLLREDMLGEIRDELQKLTGGKPGRHRGLVVDYLRLAGLDVGTDRRTRRPWGVILECVKELPQLSRIQQSKRKEHLLDNRHILRHGNMACLLLDDEPAAFPTIHRDEDELSKMPARIAIQFKGDSTLSSALSKMKTARRIKLVQLDTAVFAFEPFLKRLQEMKEVPLSEELLHWDDATPMVGPSFQPTLVTKDLQRQKGKDLRNIFQATKSIILDDSQMKSLCASLSQRVSLVQGPPGTGKSFIGALVAKVLHEYTKQIILVVCFTNHALDQFLEDLMDIGIPSEHMVRLGGKSTVRTRPLTIREQRASRLIQSQWDQVNELEGRLQQHEKQLREAFQRYSANTNKKHIMAYLEFASEELPFFETFSIPEETGSDMKLVGRRGKTVGEFYLLDRWIRGKVNAGVFQHVLPKGAFEVWKMPQEMRKSAQSRWQSAILHDLVDEIQSIGRAFNIDNAEVDKILSLRDANIIREKRIIACTTNGAARFSAAIQSASPGVVLVEEAGEILESHILTAMGPHTEQLILIGDHQQLRPKCTFELSVDGGNGFDLNRSLFERLVRKGVPHVTLTKQHRMRPEISALIRRMTYPDLTDADSTLNRSDLRGFLDNVMFIHHSELEIELNESREFRDGISTSSKQNAFEAQMILKCVRYLAQQGYGSDKMVVLTPYLGQLKLLREQLSKENDPILNDLDKFDLVRAGLLTYLSSKSSKPSLRISTVDNYQGEESDIVLVSLTRSNKAHDIGFLAQKERLNVLLSRARDALILIGNSETFIHARKGSDLWRTFLNQLKENGHVYEGFPIKCEKHPDRTGLLKSPDEFETNCPDGGCKEPCGIILKCGIHKCPSSCHQLFDHSKIKCMAVLKQQCSNSHTQSWNCHQGASAPVACGKCERDRKETERKAQKDLEDQQRRDAADEKHRKEVTKIQEEIERVTQDMKDTKLNAQRQATLKQMRIDLVAQREANKAIVAQSLQLSFVNLNTQNPSVTAPAVLIQPQASLPSNAKKVAKGTEKLQEHLKICLDHNVSQAKTEWQRQKDQENAANLAIDKIMGMIGLEDVKSQVLKIKSKVDTSVRQGTDLKKERFGLVLLGNPGTGKTTVARHYAKVLTSLQVLSGDGFIETTGSDLAHGGVVEAKNHLKQLENSEGGVYFIDEAYQLAEGHNYGGKAVLDFLLAKIENLVGEVVFVFAGYRTQMEKFFEYNPGLASRLPYTLQFGDYTNDELLTMLQSQMHNYYKNSAMDAEDGLDGLYMKIAVRRLGRGRGRDGFGNARALENLFAQIRGRQSDRLTTERRDGLTPDDHWLTKEDLIGPDPSKAIVKSAAWERLQKLTGLKSVKDSVRFMLDLIKTNYERELEEKPLIEVSLNRVFLGSPGTGKTTVAKLYGRILADIGLLSNGEVVTKNPSDFIGSAMGQSEANTKAILVTTVGKVLIIDEAYMLSSSSGGGGTAGGADMYKTAVIDTMVAEIQSVPGEDRCVLLLGYEDQMTEMFQNVNPGLTRRFPLSDAFHFDEFSDTELQEILEFKLKTQGLGATQDAVSAAIVCLGRARNGLNFGNGGDVENLISKAKGSFQARQAKLPTADRSIDFIFEPQDFDPDFDRASGAETNLRDLFKDVVGCESIIEKLDGYLQIAKGMRAQDLDPTDQIPMNFIFKGPPGTGKTTTARKFGQLYYDLGFLSEVKVIECSATDLIGQFVGQTGPKTIKQLERGLGKVLFVDEAYRLGEGMFAQEAVNELVDTMTKPRFAGKLVIILAGYDDDMNNLLRVNEGLSSRFADEIIFSSLNPDHCLRLLESKLGVNRIVFPALKDSDTRQSFANLIEELSNLPAWGNARDVETLAKSMTREFFKTNPTKTDRLILTKDTAMKCLQAMLVAKQGRSVVSTSPRPSFLGQVQAQPGPQTVPPETFHATTTLTNITEVARKEVEPTLATALEPAGETRDAGVTDAVWQQLQRDKKAAEQYTQEVMKRLQAQEDAVRVAEEMEKELAQEAATAAIREAQVKDEAERFEALRLRELARIKEAEAKAARELIQKALERQRQVELERRKKEEQVQKKLREMGVCCMGYRWIKQSGGYRCSAGGHYVSDRDLGI